MNKPTNQAEAIRAQELREARAMIAIFQKYTELRAKSPRN